MVSMVARPGVYIVREVANIPSKRISVEDVEEAFALVRKVYPDVTSEGSLGTRSFYHKGKLIAEMWVKPGKRPGWWLKIAKPL